MSSSGAGAAAAAASAAAAQVSAAAAATALASAVVVGQRPYYLDAYERFFTEGWTWVAGQGTGGTTLTSAAAQGATTLNVASGAGLINGVVLVLNAGTATQQQVKITAGGGTTALTVTALTYPAANGAAVTPLWTDNGHLTNPVGWTAFAYFIAHALRADGSKVIQDPGAQPVVFLGNSWMVTAITAYADQLQAVYPAASVVMAGVSGNSSAQLLARFDTDVPSNAAYVVMNEPGVNDAGTNVATATQQANLEALVAKCRAIGAVPVIVGGPPLSDFPAQSKQQHQSLDTTFGNPSVFPSTSVAALDARFSGTSPAGSTRVGNGAAKVDTSGSATAYGQGALSNNTTGSANTAVGQYALLANSTGNNLTALGQGALSNATGNESTAVGASALAALTTGSNNTAVGSNALAACVTGSANTALGRSALAAATGSSNVAVGRNAGRVLTTGGSNVIVGDSAGESPNFVGGNASTTANNQTLVGAFSGQSSATQRDNVTALGNAALVGAAGATALGQASQALHTDAVALGKSSVTTAVSQVAVGARHAELLNVAAPAAPSGGGRLYVESGALKYIGSSGTITTLGPA